MECHPDVHAMAECGSEKHSSGSTNRCGTDFQKSFFADHDLLLRSVLHLLALLLCCLAVQIRVPAELAKVLIAAQAEYHPLHLEIMSHDLLIQLFQFSAKLRQ